MDERIRLAIKQSNGLVLVARDAKVFAWKEVPKILRGFNIPVGDPNFNPSDNDPRTIHAVSVILSRAEKEVAPNMGLGRFRFDDGQSSVNRLNTMAGRIFVCGTIVPSGKVQVV